MPVQKPVQLHATVERSLRRRLRLALAAREENYRNWLLERIDAYLKEVETEQRRAVRQEVMHGTMVGGAV